MKIYFDGSLILHDEENYPPEYACFYHEGKKQRIGVFVDQKVNVNIPREEYEFDLEIHLQGPLTPTGEKGTVAVEKYLDKNCSYNYANEIYSYRDVKGDLYQPSKCWVVCDGEKMTPAEMEARYPW